MNWKFALVLLLIIFISGCSAKTEPDIEDNGYKLYQNSDYGFSFKYPSNWVKAPKLGMIIAFEENDKEKLLAPYVGVGQQPIYDPSYNIKDFSKAADKILMKSRGYAKISEESRKIGNTDGYEIVFDIASFRYRYIYYYKDNSAFLLVLGALQPDFDNYKDEFDYIANSYAIG